MVVSIVTYSDYAKVKYDFLDCEDVNVNACLCKAEKDETAMGDGIRTALAQIDEMRNELMEADNDHYTPILVFMTDGLPTDNPREEFAIIRERVEKDQLHVFPLGIGAGADMAMLRNMFPAGRIPAQFTTRYRMIEPENYKAIFQEIKAHVKRKFAVMVSEGDSVQSAPAIESHDVANNQMGQSILEKLLQQGLV